MNRCIQAIHYPIQIDAGTGRVRQEADFEEYIKQLIYQVLLTAPGERVHRPDFGAGLRKMVFAPNSPATASMTQTLVFQALTNWLGTFVRVDDIQAEALEERLEVRVHYTLLINREKRYLNVEVAL